MQKHTANHQERARHTDLEGVETPLASKLGRIQNVLGVNPLIIRPYHKYSFKIGSYLILQ